MFAWLVSLMDRLAPLQGPDLSHLDRLDGLTEDGSEW